MMLVKSGLAHELIAYDFITFLQLHIFGPTLFLCLDYIKRNLKYLTKSNRAVLSYTRKLKQHRPLFIYLESTSVVNVLLINSKCLWIICVPKNIILCF